MIFTNILQRKMCSYKYSVKISLSDTSFNFFYFDICPEVRLLDHMVRAWVLSHFSPVWLFVTLWTVVHQIPLSLGFSKQEYQSGLLCPPSRGSSWSRDRIHPHVSHIGQAGSLLLMPPSKPTWSYGRLIFILRNLNTVFPRGFTISTIPSTV